MLAKFQDDIGYFTVKNVNEIVWEDNKYYVYFTDDSKEVYENCNLVCVFV